MEARPWPSAAYISSNNGDSSSRAASAKRLIVRSGWSAGISVSGSMNANMLACFLVRPRTVTTSVVAATTTIDPDVPLWPYTLGRPLRVFGILVDLIYALVVNRTFVRGQDNLVDLPSPVIFAGTHHGFGDMPLVRRALARTTGRRRGWRLVTAIAAGGFNSGGPKFGHGMGLYPWYGILALGLFPLRQHAERGESLRRLVQVASAGNDVLIFPQGTHARPADERAANATDAFHPGVAHLARALAANVVPFGVAGTERVMPPDPSRFGGPLIAGIPVAVTRGPLAIVFGPQQTITPDESAEVFATRLQDVCFGLTRQAERALEAGGTPR